MKTNTLTPSTLAGRIFQHIIFWTAVILFYTFVYGRMNNNYYGTFIHLLITLPIYLGTTYFTLYFIIPRYLLKRNYRGLIVSFIYMVLGAAFLELAVTIYLVVVPMDFLSGRIFGTFNPDTLDVYIQLIGIFIVVFLAASIKLLKHWYNIQHMNQILSKEKLEAELNFLRSQIHPHFLFNTLNNLYALTIKKSDKSPEVVLRLSEMLDYMLYECNENIVSLKKEIKLIQNYIAIERLRYGHRLSIELKVKGNVSNKHIAPMLLFPFVENSFKHGVSKSVEKSWIKIKLEIEKNNLSFNIKNGLPAHDKTEDSSGGEGIGLKNVRKRLDLIYSRRYNLSINKNDNEYNVDLKIDLNNTIGELS